MATDDSDYGNDHDSKQPQNSFGLTDSDLIRINNRAREELPDDDDDTKEDHGADHDRRYGNGFDARVTGSWRDVVDILKHLAKVIVVATGLVFALLSIIKLVGALLM